MSIALPGIALQKTSLLPTRGIARVAVSFGDANADGKVDVSVDVATKVPFFGEHTATFGPVNIPTEQAITLGTAIAALLPGGAAGAAKFILGMVKGVLPH